MAEPTETQVEETNETAAENTETADVPKKTKKKTVAKTTAVETETNEAPGVVKILYIDTVMQGNQIPIGHGAVISGSGRIFTKTIEEFEGEFMTRLVQNLIKARKFIILSGLTDEQREQYGCDYQDGEVLKGTGFFEYLLTCEVDKAVELYTALCRQHREMVCTWLITQKEAGDRRVSYDLLHRLDEISRGDYADGKSPLSQLLNA